MSDELMKRLADQAEINTKILAQMEAQRQEAIELGKKLDEAIKRGGRTASRRTYLDALRGGDDAADAGSLNIEERIERAVSEVDVEHISHNGKRIALVRSMPRGLVGVEDARGLVAMRMIRMQALSQALGNGTIEDTLERSARILGKDDPATSSLETQRDLFKKAGDDKEFATRALGTQLIGGGASFVAPQFASTFVDFLFAMSVVRGMGVQSLPLVGNGGDAILFFDTAMSVGFREEGGGQNESSPQEGSLNVLRRILSGTIAVNNELLEEASWSIDAILRTHMGAAMMAHADKRFMLGRGVSNEIRGLDYWCELPTTAHYANRSLATGNVTVQTVLADIANAVGRITSENKALYADQGGKPSAIFADRDVRGLMIASEGSGGAISRPFKDEIAGGTICGLKLGRTNQLSLVEAGDAAGSGTNNKSRGWIFDAASLAIYERGGMRVEAFRGGAYKDSSGTLQSGLTNRQTVITGDMDVDFVDLYRGKSISGLRSIDWGPAFGVTV
jgi:hypothetical protein